MSGQFIHGLRTQAHEITLDRLPVQGTVPSWLTGSLLRNGPARFEVGKESYRHWFDGQAMLHRFSFQEGNVGYANRFIQSPSYKKAQETGKISFGEFATDPCRSLFQRVMSLFSKTSSANTNVNISKIGSAFVALTEVPLPIEFNPQTLETIGIVQYQDALAGQTSTAHPHYDPVRKWGINSLTHFSSRSSYNIYAIQEQKARRTLIGSMPVQEPGYMHTFGMTEQYVILTEFPLVVNPLRMAVRTRPFIENYSWKPDQGTRFIVFRKDDATIVKVFHSEASFAFHHINAFEKGDELIVDIAGLPDSTIIDEFYMHRLTQPEVSLPPAMFDRYILPLSGTTVRRERIGDESIELPRINYECNNARDYQFAYGVSIHKDSTHDFINQLVKVDTQTGNTHIWYEAGFYPGEPVFVAHPGATREDDGLILSVVLDGEQERSFLLILDASTFNELARAEVPQTIPFGFHGIYTSE